MESTVVANIGVNTDVVDSTPGGRIATTVGVLNVVVEATNETIRSALIVGVWKAVLLIKEPTNVGFITGLGTDVVLAMREGSTLVAPPPAETFINMSSHQPVGWASMSHQPDGTLCSSHQPSIYNVLYHFRIDPALAVIAEPEISDANLAITVPFADGVIKPQIVAIFPVVKDVALDAAGIS